MPLRARVTEWICDRNATTVIIPASVTSLRATSFTSTNAVREIRFESGSRITRFPSRTFCNCHSLISLSIQPSVEILGENLFFDAHKNWSTSALTTVVFEPGSKLHTIESYAFNKCPSLTTLRLPATVSRVSGLSFWQSGITNIELEPGSEFLSLENDCLIDLKRPRIIGYFGLSTQFAIPDAIEELAPGAFAGRFKLNVQVGPHSQLRSLADSAFHFCGTLSSILIPSFVMTIGDGCFNECSRLATVTFAADSVLRTIGAKAFRLCALGSVALPASVETLGADCFLSCKSLVAIAFAPGSKLVRIEKAAFADCPLLRAFRLPASVEFVGERCFVGDAALTTFEFEAPARVRELLHLPWEWDGVHEIPDSVEIIALVRGNIGYAWRAGPDRRGQRTLLFGRESGLAKIITPRYKEYRFCFLQVPARALKFLREELEFARGCVKDDGNQYRRFRFNREWE
jgi:hypothetical protein